MAASAADQSLADRVAGVSWYQSFVLPGGVITPGAFRTMDELEKLPFPVSLAGKRCLDVATADGFWAFEMERRAADEVVAIDVPPEQLDWPWNSPRGEYREEKTQAGTRAQSFGIAHEALKSKVRREELSVYELGPGAIGEFDFIFMGSLLGHLRDPVSALAAVASVLCGELLSVDAISAPLTMRYPLQPVARFDAPGWPLWWVPNVAAYRRLFAAAGLNIVATGRPFFLKRGSAYVPTYHPPVDVTRRRITKRLTGPLSARVGNPHCWVRATAR